MATRNRKFCAAVLAAALAVSMSVTAFAADESGGSITTPSNTGGGTPTLVQESGDGYSSITIYDGVSHVTPPQYTGEMQGDFQNIGEQTKTPRYYPFEITNVDEKGTWLVVKSYEVPADVNVDDIIEMNMVRDGKQYEARDILQKKTPGNVDSREANKKVTIASDTKNKQEVLKKLDSTTFYSEGGYEGYLELDEESVTTETSGTSNYSYNLTEKKEYTGLEKNDPSLIEQSIVKNGVTLKLSDVNWVSMGSTVNGNSIVSTYKAVATYSGVAYGSKADGYIVHANYKGTATKHVDGDIIYSIIYAPTIEETPPAEETPNKGWGLFGKKDKVGSEAGDQENATSQANSNPNETTLGAEKSKSFDVMAVLKALGLFLLAAVVISFAIGMIYHVVSFVIHRKQDDDEEYDEEYESEPEDDEEEIDLENAATEYYANPSDDTMNIPIDDDPNLANELFGGDEMDSAE